jgi:putative ABC transport system substrate-binding protein
VKVEYRWADGQYDRLPSLATDLASRKVALIAATGGSFSVRAAKKATEQAPVPILFVSGLDPVNEHVATLERPEGKLTGVAVQTTAQVLLKKRVDLLRALVPGATTIALLTNKNNSDPSGANGPPNAAAAAAREVHAAVTGRRATESNLHIAECGAFCPVSARTDAELDMVFASLRDKNPALVVGADPFFTDRRAQIVALAKKYGVPAIYPWREYVDAGGLMSYGSSLTSAYRQIGRYAGKILSGADPAQLPVVQDGSFELAINLKTAKQFNLTVPPALMASSDYRVK